MALNHGKTLHKQLNLTFNVESKTQGCASLRKSYQMPDQSSHIFAFYHTENIVLYQYQSLYTGHFKYQHSSGIFYSYICPL